MGAQPEGVGAPVDETDLDDIFDNWGGSHRRGDEGSRLWWAGREVVKATEPTGRLTTATTA